MQGLTDARFAEFKYLHYKKHYIVEMLRKERIEAKPSVLPLFHPVASSSTGYSNITNLPVSKST